MSHFKITRFTVRFQAVQSIHLPAYAGSTLRGAFGHALKNISCLSSSQHEGNCRCSAFQACLYRKLFDPDRQVLNIQSRLQDIPSPFVIEAHSLPQHIDVGQQAHFFMTLFGDFAHSQIMLIQLAWQRALSVGLGRDISNQGQQAALISFDVCDQPIALPDYSEQLRLDLISHARIQHHGKFLNTQNFDASLFCRSIVRRYLTLMEVYGSDILADAQIRALFDAVNQVEGHAVLERQVWSRWSNRKKQKMQMDGLIGTIYLNHVDPILLPYLYLGQWLHVGKGTVFGLGQYSLVTQQKAMCA